MFFVSQPIVFKQAGIIILQILCHMFYLLIISRVSYQQVIFNFIEKTLIIFCCRKIETLLLPRRDGRAVECGGLENR